MSEYTRRWCKGRANSPQVRIPGKCHGRRRFGVCSLTGPRKRKGRILHFPDTARTNQSHRKRRSCRTWWGCWQCTPSPSRPQGGVGRCRPCRSGYTKHTSQRTRRCSTLRPRRSPKRTHPRLCSPHRWGSCRTSRLRIGVRPSTGHRLCTKRRNGGWSDRRYRVDKAGKSAERQSSCPCRRR